MWPSPDYHELFKRHARRPFKWRRKTNLPPEVETTTPIHLPESNDVWWSLVEPETRLVAAGANYSTTTSWDMDNLTATNLTASVLDMEANSTLSSEDDQMELAIMVATALVLGLIILATVIGRSDGRVGVFLNYYKPSHHVKYSIINNITGLRNNVEIVCFYSARVANAK